MRLFSDAVAKRFKDIDPGSLAVIDANGKSLPCIKAVHEPVGRATEGFAVPVGPVYADDVAASRRTALLVAQRFGAGPRVPLGATTH